DRHQATLVKREAKAEQRVADDRSGRLVADD
ncbi:MAG: flagellar biosynthesis protein FliJ, partial [Methyloversatilis sp. 12-65-5]